MIFLPKSSSISVTDTKMNKLQVYVLVLPTSDMCQGKVFCSDQKLICCTLKKLSVDLMCYHN